MADIRKRIENLKPGKEYLVTVRAKNADLNVVSDFADSVRFVVPQDQTEPNAITNLELFANFEKVMFKFDFSQDKDISRYEYELYNFNSATPPNLVSSGFSAANVFTISVENSYKQQAASPNYGTFNQVNISYWGRVRGIDTTGNAGPWTNLTATDRDTPLISEEFIDSLTASKITAGTIGAATITLNGANSIIKSSTFDGVETSPGSGSYANATTGWLINGLGKSYFYDATVVGSIDIGGFDSGSFHVDTTGNMWLGSGIFANAPFRVSNDGSLDVNVATPAQSFHIDKYGNMWSGSDVYGSARFRVNNQGSLITSDITVTGGSWTGGIVGGLNTASDKIYITSSPVATFADVNTQFYVDNTGRMSLKDKFQWNGTTLSINGSITATTGTIGGWSIGLNSLTGGGASLSSSGVLTLGTVNDVVILSAADATYRIWAGHATPGSAPFSVTKTGALVANNATISGVVNATSGNFTSTVTIGSGATSGQLTVGTNATNIKIIGTNTANTTAIYSGSSSYGSGGFWLDASGRFSLGTVGSGKSFTWDGTDTTISGSSIIGGTIKTSANTGNGSTAGVIIDSTSARFYNSSSSTAVTTISTADGSITSTNGTFTGGIFRTSTNVGVGSPNAGAGVIFDSSGIRGFSGTGTSAIFSLDATGALTATNANISGQITASTGSIGGFTISSTLFAGSGSAFVGLNPAATPFFAGATSNTGTGAIFSVTNTGVLTAANANITGRITANTGSIGGFTIGATLSAGSGSAFVGLNPAATPFFAGATSNTGTGAVFSVTNTGVLTATNANITGRITASTGSIGGFTIDTNLYAGSGSAFVGMNPSSLPFFAGATSNTGTGAVFSVTNTGVLTATNANITGQVTANTGSIGGFTISSTLYAGSGSAFVGLNPAATPFFAGATSSTGAGALFSVTNSGFLTSTSGRIGGWNIGVNSLTGTNAVLSSAGILTLGSGNNVVVASSADATYALWAGNAAGLSAPFSVTKTGDIKAISGTIGGWNLSSTELYSGSGLSRISFNSSTGVIAIGQGNHGSVDTGFYTDGTGKFSLSNQLIFNPAAGSTISVKFTGNVSSGSPSITSISALEITGLKIGMTVTGTGIQSGSYITSVGVSSITLNLNANASNNGVSLTAVLDDFSELQVVGKIKGVVESTNPIGSPRLSTSTTQIVVSGTSPNQTATITTAGHAFIANEKILIENLPATNGLNNLNREFVIASVTDSITLVISLSGITGVTSTTTSTTAGILTLRELTMGLHPAESIGTSYEHSQGTGIRLDKFNWWLTNNQLRVGSSGAYLSWNGSKFVIQGGGSKTLRMNVGSLDVDNYYSIVNVGATPTYANSNTPFYADGSGRFSIADKISYSGNLGSPVLTIDGTVVIGGTAASTIVSNASTALQPGSAANDVNSNVTTISGGKIRTGSIQSTTYTYVSGTFSSSGMQVNLDSAGAITAKNFAIDGSGNAFFNGTVTATAGSIGGFTISSTLSAGSGSAFVGLNPAATPFFAGATSNTGTGAVFSVTNTGILTATNANITGQVTANTGSIGGFTIGATLSAGSGSAFVGLNPSSLPFFAGATSSTGTGAVFSVTNTGVLTATNANITGQVTANTGSIGGFTISSTLYAGSGSAFVGLNPAATPFFAGATSSTGAGAVFSVMNTGALTAANANITGGSIDFNSANPANSFHINNSGQLWTGASAYANAKFRVDNTGVVRIGSPSSALYINNDGAINIGSGLGVGPFAVSSTGTVTIGSAPNFFNISNAGRVSIGTASSALYIDNDGSITIGTTWGNGLFKVSASGQVDIGATPPQSFHISPQGNVWAGADQSASPPFKLSNDGSIDVGGNDSTSVHISALGDVYAGTQKAAIPTSAQYFITSITGTNTSELTITATPNHDFVNGQKITVSGVFATPAFGLNTIDQPVTVINASTFKVPNPLYNTIVAVFPNGGVANTIQYQTLKEHRFRTGHVVTISGITPSGYNGTYVITSIDTPNVFSVTNTTTGTATLNNATAVLQNAARTAGGVARRIPPFSLTASTGAVRASVVVASGTIFGSANHLDLDNILNVGSNITIGRNTIYGTNSFSSYDEAGKFNFSLNAENGFIGRLGTNTQIQMGSSGVILGQLIPLKSLYAWNNTGGAGANVVIDSSGLFQKISSSIRYKRDIKPLDLQECYKVLNLEPVSFKYKNDTNNITNVGFIAEEVAKVDERFVYLIEDENNKSELIPETVYYDKLIAPLIAVVKDLSDRISKLEN